MKKLIFVYNGDSGVINSIMHLMHKTFSPSTYECRLCALVYDSISMNKDWMAFVNTLGVEVEYHHRDTFLKTYKHRYQDYPVVLMQEAGKFETVLDAPAFAGIETLKDLMQIVSHRVSGQYVPRGDQLMPTKG